MGLRLGSCFDVNAVVRIADWLETQWKGILDDILELAESLSDEGVDQWGTALLSFLLCDCCRSGA